MSDTFTTLDSITVDDVLVKFRAENVLPTPRPAYVVQNPNCCGAQTFGCGCGVA